MMVSAPSTTRESTDAIQSPTSTKRPTLPKLLERPLTKRIPKENKNNSGIRTTKNIEIPQSMLGTGPTLKSSKGHSTMPKKSRTRLATKIETIIEVDTIKKSIPSSLKMILGIALRIPSKN